MASDGSLTAPTVNAITDINANGTITGGSIVGLSGDITTLTVDELLGDRVNVTDIDTSTLDVTGSSTVNDLSAQSIETLSLVTGVVTTSTLEVTDAYVTTLHAGIGTQIDTTENLNLQGNNVVGVGTIVTSTIHSNYVNGDEYGVGSGRKLKIEYDQRNFAGSTLPAIVFEMFNSSGVSLGQTYFQLYT